MTDVIDHDGLYLVTESQAGHFTASQAIAVGMDRSTLRYHARPGGRYERVARGLYRLRYFPTSPHEHVVAAWLGLGESEGVVSHESALELYELSDVIPRVVHISLPRSRRGRRSRPGVQLHMLARPAVGAEIRRRGGVPVTSPERTLVDALGAGTQPDQVEIAVAQALERGLTTQRRILAAAAGRSSRVRALIERFLEESVTT